MRLFVIYYTSAIHNKKNMGPKLKYLFIISKLFKTFCKKIKPIYVDTQANPCLFRIYITTVQRNFSIRSVALDWDHSSDVLGYKTHGFGVMDCSVFFHLRSLLLIFAAD